MIFVDRSASLCHYGVLGMRWGVRKDGKPQGFQYGGEHEENFESSPLSKTLNSYGNMSAELEYDNGMLRKWNDTSKDADMYMANAQYNLFDDENKGNCLLCSMAYDMRRKGYAVHAGANDGNGTSDAELRSYYKDELTYSPAGLGSKEGYIHSMMDNAGVPRGSSIDEDIENLSNFFESADEDTVIKAMQATHYDHCNKISEDIETYMPPNAEGKLSVGWMPSKPNIGFESTDSHAMTWETDSDGHVSYRDCQTRETYTPEEFAENLAPYINPAFPGTAYRLDNATPDIERMLEDGVICNDNDYEIHVQPNYVITPTGILPPIPEDD